MGKLLAANCHITIIILVSRMSSGHGGAHINPVYPLTQEVTDTSAPAVD